MTAVTKPADAADAAETVRGRWPLADWAAGLDRIGSLLLVSFLIVWGVPRTVTQLETMNTQLQQMSATQQQLAQTTHDLSLELARLRGSEKGGL
ncbi:MAG TPA: hypothetical protein VHN99_05920 [Deinococcales bacterium]|nr:hypothetical protein [Deinococcales bacterium]